MLDSTSLVNFLVLGVIGWITYKIYIWPFYISPLRKIPGPPSENPFYGNLKTLIIAEVNNTFNWQSLILILTYLYISYISYSLIQPDDCEPQLKWIRKYGNLVKYHGLFNKPTLFVADPKIIQEMTFQFQLSQEIKVILH